MGISERCKATSYSISISFGGAGGGEWEQKQAYSVAYCLEYRYHDLQPDTTLWASGNHHILWQLQILHCVLIWKNALPIFLPRTVWNAVEEEILEDYS